MKKHVVREPLEVNLDKIRAKRCVNTGGEENVIEAQAVISVMWVVKTALVLRINPQEGHQKLAGMVHRVATSPRADVTLSTIRAPDMRTGHHSTQGRTKGGVPGSRLRGLSAVLEPTVTGL